MMATANPVPGGFKPRLCRYRQHVNIAVGTQLDTIQIARCRELKVVPSFHGDGVLLDGVHQLSRRNHGNTENPNANTNLTSYKTIKTVLKLCSNGCSVVTTGSFRDEPNFEVDTKAPGCGDTDAIVQVNFLRWEKLRLQLHFLTVYTWVHCHYVAVHAPCTDIHSIRVNIKIEVDHCIYLICRTPALTVKVVVLKVCISHVVLAGSGTEEVNILWDRGLKPVNCSTSCEHSIVQPVIVWRTEHLYSAPLSFLEHHLQPEGEIHRAGTALTLHNRV